jgi:hypothetical protein
MTRIFSEDAPHALRPRRAESGSRRGEFDGLGSELIRCPIAGEPDRQRCTGQVPVPMIRQMLHIVRTCNDPGEAGARAHVSALKKIGIREIGSIRIGWDILNLVDKACMSCVVTTVCKARLGRPDPAEPDPIQQPRSGCGDRQRYHQQRERNQEPSFQHCPTIERASGDHRNR